MKANVLFVAVVVAALLAGWTRADVVPDTPEAKQALHHEVQSALTQMEKKDPDLKKLLDGVHAYAIYPSIAKGGLVVGGAYGKGEVYVQGTRVGYTDLTQGSFGLQAGGKQYAELVLFKTPEAFNRFREGNFSLGANASATALKAGASASVQFQDGVAVVTMPEGGLMADVSIGGQKLNFVPLAESNKQIDK